MLQINRSVRVDHALQQAEVARARAGSAHSPPSLRRFAGCTTMVRGWFVILKMNPYPTCAGQRSCTARLST